MVKQAANRQGVALITVMVLVIMISLGVYSYAQLMTAQEAGTVMSGRRMQARAAVASGVEYLKDYLTLTPTERVDLGGHWDNPAYFQNVSVMDDGVDNLRFSILSIDDDDYGDPQNIRYGLTDEGSKLNVNYLVSEAYAKVVEAASEGAEEAVEAVVSADAAESEESEEEQVESAARDALLVLPGMTEPIADSILDWIDEDDIPRDFGLEADGYSAFGYEPRNGPITNLDELLLIPGVTMELLYGADRNHNGVLETNEQGGGDEGAGGGSMARGWSAYLTTLSLDAVEQAEETIDLNGDDLEALYDDLIAGSFEPDFAAYVVAYRQSGPYTPEIPEDAPEDFTLPEPEFINGRQPDFSQPGQTEINSVLDLLGTMSQATFPTEGQQQAQPVVVQSPYMDNTQLATVLPQMMGQLTAGGELGGSSGVNTNHCPSPVMSGLPNLDADLVQNILQMQDRRQDSGDYNYLYSTWPLGVGAVSIEQMKELLPFVAGQGTVFRAQIVGYSDVPGVFARAEVVIDASGDSPRVVSWRDLSHLGPGFTLDTLTQ